MAIQVSVIGSGAEHEENAEDGGRLLAEGGATVVTGGLGEVMAAASRGAKTAGGTTIGILPGETRAQGERVARPRRGHRDRARPQPRRRRDGRRSGRGRRTLRHAGRDRLRAPARAPGRGARAGLGGGGARSGRGRRRMRSSFPSLQHGIQERHDARPPPQPRRSSSRRRVAQSAFVLCIHRRRKSAPPLPRRSREAEATHRCRPPGRTTSRARPSRRFGPGETSRSVSLGASSSARE